jgi:hypothetical protein
MVHRAVYDYRVSLLWFKQPQTYLEARHEGMSMGTADRDAVELASKDVAGSIKPPNVAVATGRQSTVWPL